MAVSKANKSSQPKPRSTRPTRSQRAASGSESRRQTGPSSESERAGASNEARPSDRPTRPSDTEAETSGVSTTGTTSQLETEASETRSSPDAGAAVVARQAELARELSDAESEWDASSLKEETDIETSEGPETQATPQENVAATPATDEFGQLGETLREEIALPSGETMVRERTVMPGNQEIQYSEIRSENGVPTETSVIRNSPTGPNGEHFRREVHSKLEDGEVTSFTERREVTLPSDQGVQLMTVTGVADGEGGFERDYKLTEVLGPDQGQTLHQSTWSSSGEEVQNGQQNLVGFGDISPEQLQDFHDQGLQPGGVESGRLRSEPLFRQTPGVTDRHSGPSALSFTDSEGYTESPLSIEFADLAGPGEDGRSQVTVTDSERQVRVTESFDPSGQIRERSTQSWEDSRYSGDHDLSGLAILDGAVESAQTVFDRNLGGSEGDLRRDGLTLESWSADGKLEESNFQERHTFTADDNRTQMILEGSSSTPTSFELRRFEDDGSLSTQSFTPGTTDTEQTRRWVDEHGLERTVTTANLQELAAQASSEGVETLESYRVETAIKDGATRDDLAALVGGDFERLVAEHPGFAEALASSDGFSVAQASISETVYGGEAQSSEAITVGSGDQTYRLAPDENGAWQLQTLASESAWGQEFDSRGAALAATGVAGHGSDLANLTRRQPTRPKFGLSALGLLDDALAFNDAILSADGSQEGRREIVNSIGFSAMTIGELGEWSAERLQGSGSALANQRWARLQNLSRAAGVGGALLTVGTGADALIHDGDIRGAFDIAEGGGMLMATAGQGGRGAVFHALKFGGPVIAGLGIAAGISYDYVDSTRVAAQGI